MISFRALWPSKYLAVACVASSALAAPPSALDPSIFLTVEAHVGFWGKPLVVYSVAGNVSVYSESPFGKLLSFEMKYPNGAVMTEGGEPSIDGTLGFRYAEFPDLKSIPAGDYTLTVTGSLAGTRTYEVNVNPAIVPGPVDTQFLESTRAALAAAPLDSFTLKLKDPVYSAGTTYLGLSSSSGTLFSEESLGGGVSRSVKLPMNLLMPGQTAHLLVQYRTTIFGGVSSVYYSSIYSVEFTAALPQAPTQLANISARGFCGAGDRVMIGGFVVGGNTNKRVLVRALGPTLTSRGLSPTEVLLDPSIEVYKGTNLVATNDNWGSNSNIEELIATANKIGAGGIATDDTTSSALLLTLSPGVYSFVANGKLGTSGITLLEVYDADTDTSGSRFVNISTRAYSTTGNGGAIGGFVISGGISKQILIRAVGPTLTKLGIRQADVLVDPMIELHDASHGNLVIGTNDNWGDNANAAAITSTAARIGANALDAADANSSAMLLTLKPGAYTFVATGKNSTSGIVLVEVYDAD